MGRMLGHPGGGCILVPRTGWVAFAVLYEGAALRGIV
jgi:hypothetical protein